MTEIEKEKLKKFLKLAGYERLSEWQKTTLEKIIDILRKDPDINASLLIRKQTCEIRDQLILLAMLFEESKEKL